MEDVHRGALFGRLLRGGFEDEVEAIEAAESSLESARKAGGNWGPQEIALREALSNAVGAYNKSFGVKRREKAKADKPVERKPEGPSYDEALDRLKDTRREEDAQVAVNAALGGISPDERMIVRQRQAVEKKRVMFKEIAENVELENETRTKNAKKRQEEAEALLNARKDDALKDPRLERKLSPPGNLYARDDA